MLTVPRFVKAGGAALTISAGRGYYSRGSPEARVCVFQRRQRGWLSVAKLASPKVRVRRMALGRGVYAVRRLRRNQTIGEITGRIVEDPHYGSEYCIELGPHRNMEPKAPFRYLNHSCEPNCEVFSWKPRRGEDPSVSDRLWLQALRTIEPGEELTIDYGWSADAAIRCQCQATGCRGWVVAREELPSLLRKQRSEANAGRSKRAPAAGRPAKPGPKSAPAAGRPAAAGNGKPRRAAGTPTAGM